MKRMKSPRIISSKNECSVFKYSIFSNKFTTTEKTSKSIIKKQSRKPFFISNYIQFSRRCLSFHIKFFITDWSITQTRANYFNCCSNLKLPTWISSSSKHVVLNLYYNEVVVQRWDFFIEGIRPTLMRSQQMNNYINGYLWGVIVIDENNNA